MKSTQKSLGLSFMVIALILAVQVSHALASQPKFVTESGEFALTFTGSGAEGKLEVLPQGSIIRFVNCRESSSTGTISTSTTIEATKVIFKGCAATLPSLGANVNCQNTKNSGEIVTNLLEGSLIYVKAGSPETGIDLEPESTPEFAKFTCGSFLKETISVTESVIGIVTPVNASFGVTFTVSFSQKDGHQEPEGYLASSGCSFVKNVLMTTGSGVDTFGPLQSGVQGTETIKTSQPIKISATKCA